MLDCGAVKGSGLNHLDEFVAGQGGGDREIEDVCGIHVTSPSLLTVLQ
jgi:hypothetical protein